jgi:hypothetical protein
MKEILAAGVLALSLSGCSLFGLNSLEPGNLIKTATTSTVAYVTGGPIPALGVLLSSVAVDEVLPDDKPAITEIEEGNKEQMIAYIAQNIMSNILYVIIGFLVFTNVIGPWAAQRRARRKAEAAAEDARRKDKYDRMKAELNARRAVEK